MNPTIGIRISLNLAKCFMVLLKIVHFLICAQKLKVIAICRLP